MGIAIHNQGSIEIKHTCIYTPPITGDLNIILRKVISHGPKFREPQHINWKHNFKIIMDAVEDYARRWIKREVDQDPELEFLSDEFRTMRNHLSENDIQITSDYVSRWVVLKRRVGAVTSQRVLKVLFYVNILQCFFVVEILKQYMRVSER
jgi:hypothetical protein